mmetsp:Transcript_119490/g.283671  ORF Transcript_119490/g.283671 Transcript_119490/m.283671 type:complete len:205 (+) Transcript_119490:66-680(+)
MARVIQEKYLAWLDVCQRLDQHLLRPSEPAVDDRSMYAPEAQQHQAQSDDLGEAVGPGAGQQLLQPAQHPMVCRACLPLKGECSRSAAFHPRRRVHAAANHKDRLTQASHRPKNLGSAVTSAGHATEEAEVQNQSALQGQPQPQRAPLHPNCQGVALDADHQKGHNSNHQAKDEHGHLDGPVSLPPPPQIPACLVQEQGNARHQ